MNLMEIMAVAGMISGWMFAIGLLVVGYPWLAAGVAVASIPIGAGLGALLGASLTPR